MIEWTHSIIGCDRQPSTYCCAVARFEGGEATASSVKRAGPALAESFAVEGWRWVVAMPDGGRVRSMFGSQPMAAEVTFEALSAAPGAVVLVAPR